MRVINTKTNELLFSFESMYVHNFYHIQGSTFLPKLTHGSLLLQRVLCYNGVAFMSLLCRILEEVTQKRHNCDTSFPKV
jgi:hypothetical protein